MASRRKIVQFNKKFIKEYTEIFLCWIKFLQNSFFGLCAEMWVMRVENNRLGDGRFDFGALYGLHFNLQVKTNLCRVG